MRKLILIGPAINIPVFYGKRPDYEEEVERLRVQDYLNPNNGPLNDSAEIFLHAHGGLICLADSLSPYLFLSIFDDVPISLEPILVTHPSTTLDSDSDLVAPELKVTPFVKTNFSLN